MQYANLLNFKSYYIRKFQKILIYVRMNPIISVRLFKPFQVFTIQIFNDNI